MAVPGILGRVTDVTEQTRTKRRTKRTDDTLAMLREAGFAGLTWRDYAARDGSHHGQASGALSRLDRLGQAFRLRERRAGCSVYVHPDFLEGREVVVRKPQRPPIPEDWVDPTAYAELQEVLRDVMDELARVRLEYAEELQALSHDADVRVRQGRAELQTELMATQREAIVAARKMALDEGYKKGLAEGHDKAELEWQTGYDEGVRVTTETIAASHEASLVAIGDGDDPYAKGLVEGRVQGETAARRHVEEVAGAIFRVIRSESPIKSHFQGCYKIHPDCAVRAVAQSIGVTPDRLRAGYMSDPIYLPSAATARRSSR